LIKILTTLLEHTGINTVRLDIIDVQLSEIIETKESGIIDISVLRHLKISLITLTHLLMIIATITHQAMTVTIVIIMKIITVAVMTETRKLVSAMTIINLLPK
jgi:hypothetical protein